RQGSCEVFTVRCAYMRFQNHVGGVSRLHKVPKSIDFAIIDKPVVPEDFSRVELIEYAEKNFQQLDAQRCSHCSVSQSDWFSRFSRTRFYEPQWDESFAQLVTDFFSAVDPRTRTE